MFQDPEPHEMHYTSNTNLNEGHTSVVHLITYLIPLSLNWANSAASSKSLLRSLVKHAREVAEASTLEVFDHLRQGRISQALDVVSCRLISLEVTASNKGDFAAAKDWECKTPAYTTLAG